MKSRILFSAIIIVLFSTLVSNAQTIKKGPYLMLTENNTAMKVLWQNTASSTDVIKWGTDLSYSMGTANSSTYGTDFQHSYTISGLTAGTKYYYQVTVNGVAKSGSFYTPPSANATSVKFLAYGDTRTNISYHNDVAARINATCAVDPAYQSLLISMGDLVSAGYNESPWTSEFFNYSYPNLMQMLATIPYESAIGNHELSGTSTLFGKYFPYSFAGAYYYSFDYGPAHFVVLDQYTAAYTVGSAQYNWLVNELSTSTKPWKFVYFHEPGWTAGGGHENNTTVQTVLEPLFEKYNVSIVFAGHNHYYARAEVPASNGSIIHHVTAGAAGAPLYTPNLTYPYIVSGCSCYHFCKINIVDNNVLQFQAIKSDGSIIDQFTIDRTPKPPVISNVQSGNITTASALITWTTDIASSSDVEYGLTTSYGYSATGAGNVTSHNVQLSGLQPGTLYHYRVKSNGVYSGDYTFATPLQITNVQAIGITDEAANITWNTTNAASSDVEYGLSAAYGSTATAAENVTSHNVPLSGLSANTLYHYRVKSNGIFSTDYTFTTLSTPILITAVSATNITAVSAVISWTTNLLSGSDVEYGTTTAYGSAATVAGSTTSHSVPLSGLTPGTLYHFRVKSNGTYSADYTFSTSALTSNKYVPVSTTIVQGAVATGTFDNLKTSDNSYYVVKSKTTKPYYCEWYGSFKINEAPSSVVKFTVIYEGKNSRSLTQALSLYNFSLGIWVQFDSRNISTKDVTISFTQNAPANFISATGEIRVRVNGNASKSFTCSGDFMQIDIQSNPAPRSAEAKPIASMANVSHDEFYCYPNPTKTTSILHLGFAESKWAEVALFDLSGRKVAEVCTQRQFEAGAHDIKYETGNLKPGVYFYSILTSNSAGAVSKQIVRLVVMK